MGLRWQKWRHFVVRRKAGYVGLVVAALTAFPLLGSPASALATAPVPGSFTGQIPGYTGGLTFYVSADSTHLQDVSIPADDLKCTGEGSATMHDHLEAFEIKIEAGDTFGTTQTAEGQLEGHSVTFTFTFSGAFATNGEEASGTYREEIAFAGSTRACTTGNESFTAKRDTQPTQTTAAPPAGSYTSNIPGYTGGLTFYVSADSTHLQDVSIPADDLKCTGEGSATMHDHLEAFEVPLETVAGNNASFLYAGGEKGTLEGKPVSISFVFNGHFHSVNSKEVERAAGTYREDITFEGGSTRKCTTDNQPFSATRDTQPTQTTAAPPAGSYTGNIPGYTGGLGFEVASNSRDMLNVKIPTDDLKCTGEGSTTGTDKLEIAKIAVKSKVNFKATVKGTSSGKGVSFTYTFTGHFHSVNNANKERAAGMYREELTFAGSTRRCTTNNQSFSSAHT